MIIIINEGKVRVSENQNSLLSDLRSTSFFFLICILLDNSIILFILKYRKRKQDRNITKIIVN